MSFISEVLCASQWPASEAPQGLPCGAGKPASRAPGTGTLRWRSTGVTAGLQGRAGTPARGFRVVPEVPQAQVRKKLGRKSTRLNSSLSQISYAVFCLKKKKKKH